MAAFCLLSPCGSDWSVKRTGSRCWIFCVIKTIILMTKVNKCPEIAGFLLGFCWSDFPYLFVAFFVTLLWFADSLTVKTNHDQIEWLLLLWRRQFAIACHKSWLPCFWSWLEMLEICSISALDVRKIWMSQQLLAIHLFPPLSPFFYGKRGPLNQQPRRRISWWSGHLDLRRRC